MTIYMKLQDKTPEGYYLVADTAFLHSGHFLEGWIKAPLKAGQQLPTDPQEKESNSYGLTVSCYPIDSQLSGVCVHFRAHLEGCGCQWTSTITSVMVIFWRSVQGCTIFMYSV